MKAIYHSIVIIGLLLIFAGCSQTSAPEADTEPSVRPVRYIQLKAESVDQSRIFSGTAKAAKEAVLSFKVPGTIKSIPVKVGDRIKAGTLLAELDKTDLLVDLESTRAGLITSQADAKSTQAKVNTTRSNYRRIQNLYENNNVSLSEFEQTRGDYETAVAQLQAANSRIKTERTKLEAAQNQLQYTRLNAPFQGVISEVYVDENEEVSAGKEIMVLSGLGNLEVNVNVSDLYISRITKGMACRIIFPVLKGLAVKGQVGEVSYGAVESPTYPVTIVIQEKDERLRPGMAARVNFEFVSAETAAGLYIPADGVGSENEENFVFVIKPDTGGGKGTVEKRPVTIGDLTENGFLVKSGLSSGEIVATSGLQLLMEGMVVKLLDDPVKEW